ncbi:MAG: DUF2624 domain-containing protein [Caldibacillus debilis]|uniref:DUF2624 domain-containing protein n=1 Tax=Caldibacillus debilis TaxID=301148 RepID=A0A150MDD7_9BACI|nr:DUF2624 family protein [Caldibacillus debilis]KYD22473.1 hypothetical protein B4135_1263 [Caldibacillus debilis]REJ26123.1 MAG: DUF2624 domain-containing protein [Caldibacillus debilis]
MGFLENLIQMKLKTATGKDVMKISRAFELGINEAAAEKIAAYLRKNPVNILNHSDRLKLVKEISRIAGDQPAKKIYRILSELTR